MVIDHHEIEERHLAERYLSDDLDAALRSAFSDHVVECEECWDRLQLAQIWLKQEREHPVSDRPAQTLYDHPENGYFQSVHFTETAEVIYPSHANGAAAQTSTALVLVPFRPWQVPALTTLAALLAVALEFIQHQQLELARKPDAPKLPPMARWVMQFEPWHILLLGTLTALLLVLMPTTYFLWELQKLAR